MNFESSMASDDNAGYSVEQEDLGRRQRRRKLILIAIAVLVAIAALWAYRSRQAEAAKASAASEAKGGKSAPTVSYIVPGRTDVAFVINATGTLAARREMPVGIAGEGGMVARVLVEPGQWVGQGQVLATIDRRVQSEQSRSLAAQVGVAQADARLAQNELDRARQLVSRGFISKADIDRKTAARDAAAARVRVAQAQLSTAQASNSRLDIRAPAAGLVLTRNVEPGQVVSAGSGVLFRMAKGGEMEMRALVGEADLARLSSGVPATVTPVGTDKSFKGSVWQIAPVIDPQSRQGTARIALAYDSALRPGGFASAKIGGGSVTAPLLPESAVQSDASGSYVMVVGADDKVARRKVTLGEVTDRGLPVIEGLAGNERIVLRAGAFLTPGQKIKPVRTTVGG